LGPGQSDNINRMITLSMITLSGFHCIIILFFCSFDFQHEIVFPDEDYSEEASEGDVEQGESNYTFSYEEDPENPVSLEEACKTTGAACVDINLCSDEG
jgi:hypothetical protein